MWQESVFTFLVAIILLFSCNKDRKKVIARAPKSEQKLSELTTIRIFIEPSGGLIQDFKILKARLAPRFHVVSQEEFSGPVDLNIFVEQVHREFFPRANHNFILTNQEQVWSVNSYSKLDRVLCKTQHCMKIMEAFKKAHGLAFDLYFLGFTSDFPLSSQIKKNYNSFVHLAGKSPFKNTGLVLDTWRKHPQLPHIVVTCVKTDWQGDCYHVHLVGENSPDKIKNYKNITLHTSYLPEAELAHLADSAGFFVAPSEVEGYGHYLNQGRAAGAIVITVDAPPMNEMVDRNSGFLVQAIEKSKKIGLANAPLFSFNPADLLAQVNKALDTDGNMKQFMSEQSMLKYQLDTEAFEKNLKDLFAPMPPSPVVEKPILQEGYGEIHIPNKHFKVGVVLTVLDRPDLLKKAVESLAHSHLNEDTLVIVVDDHSESQETINIVKAFTLSKATLVKVRLLKNQGLLKAMLTGMNLMNGKVDYIMNLDSDMYVKEHWLDELIDTFIHIDRKINSENFLLTGFNIQSHATIGCEDLHDYKEIQVKCCSLIRAGRFFCEKKDVGGVNLLFSSKFYKTHVHDLLEKILKDHSQSWDEDLVRDFQQNHFPIFASSPSVIQHSVSSETNDKSRQPGDFAEDF